ncbi:MAG: photosynthetic reaction center subunit H [Erythrobacter sp.]|nr:photosynthetic reaction center subunit H [Erythrobacter sp.]MDZ4138174.1 photosynthetic reaction center subunit H [Erythrobacter sp.]MDZ4271869.1 photosynthetic reaction center subunit H [Erythrobacter sp.]MDZ4276866.1 photosynthetic reaction center subunit H [Erythrobacter sp.]PKP97726.1 MAG: photosynthetic reaction center subunit H [Alphaproteobacteria bacterium HGW-Alphaproteobacteria-15]
MNTAYIVGTFDVAELAFLLFFVFFIALVFYLNKESRREGYPLEDEVTGLVENGSSLFDGAKKSFQLPHGRGTYVPEDVARDDVNVPAVQAFRAGGAPWVPSGDAMIDGMGPAAFANRSKYPDLTYDGRPRIVPIADSHEMIVSPNDPQLIGWPVIAADKKTVGKVSDIWVDQAEHIIRYLEVETTTGKKVLAPMMVASVHGNSLLSAVLPIIEDQPKYVEIDAITADQFERVPALETAGIITRYEEDRVQAYFGGGYLYATPERAEPWI